MELAVDEERRCPRCDTPGAVSRGRARGLRRYPCEGGGRTFDAVTGTPLSGPHRKERWLSFGEALATGETVKVSTECCGVSVGTAFRWRHRSLEAAPEKVKGIVEADETYVLESRKGERNLKRKARRRRRGTVSAVPPAVTADALRKRLNPQSRETPFSSPTPIALIPLARPRSACATRRSTRRPGNGCAAPCTFRR